VIFFKVNLFLFSIQCILCLFVFFVPFIVILFDSSKLYFKLGLFSCINTLSSSTVVMVLGGFLYGFVDWLIFVISCVGVNKFSYFFVLFPVVLLLGCLLGCHGQWKCVCLDISMN